MLSKVERIANILLTNLHNNSGTSKGIGLFQGNMGICLALYYLNKDLKIQSLEDSASILINDTYNKFSTNVTPNFDIGLAGIGWVIDHLVRNGFCEGNANDILRDIDALIFRDINETEKIPLNVTNGLIGYLIYVISRLENKSKKEEYEVLSAINRSLFRNIIDRIDRIMPSIFPSLSKDLGFSILWQFPVLLIYLKKALELNIYNNKIKNMISGWLFYLNGLIPAIYINRLYLAVSLTYLNQYLHSVEIKKQIEILMYSIDFKSIKLEIDPLIMDINEGWFSAVIIMKKAEELLTPDYPNYSCIYDARVEFLKKYSIHFEKYLQGNTDRADISIIHGLSGIGLLFKLFPQAFEVN